MRPHPTTRRRKPRSDTNDIALFWSRVLKTESCWIWQGGIRPSGYGRFRYQGKEWRAHRLAWVLAHGSLDDEICVLHDCDQFYAVGDISYRLCVNPAHLWLGDRADNAADRDKKGRGIVGYHHRGDDSASRKHPEGLAFGDRNGARTHPEMICKGERNGRAILRLPDVERLRFFVDSGQMTIAEASRSFGISFSQAARIVHRESWAS